MANHTPLSTTFEIDFPEYNAQAMGCGLEDRNITDRYDAMRYGWDNALDHIASRIPDSIFDADQMREFASANAKRIEEQSAALQAALRTNASMLQAACMVIKDDDARHMALEAVKDARAAIAAAESKS